MAAKRGKRRHRPPKNVPLAERATILVYAETRTRDEAAERFHVSTRSIDRWVTSLKNGADPELAKLVAEHRASTAERCRDVLAQTQEMALKRLQDLLPTMTAAEVMRAVEVLTDAVTTKQTMGLDDGPEDDSQDPAAPEAPRGGYQAAGGETDQETAVH